MSLKKNIIVLLITLPVNIEIAHAQIFRLGPQIGLSRWKSTFDGKYESSNSGLQIGIVSRIQLPLLYIQPEVLTVFDFYNVKKKSTLSKCTINRLVAPLSIGLSFFDILRIQAGVIASFPYGKSPSNTNEKSIENIDIKKFYQSVRWAYQAGIGVDVGNVLLDVVFEGSFSKAFQKVAGNLKNYRPKQIVLKVGYNLI